MKLSYKDKDIITNLIDVKIEIKTEKYDFWVRNRKWLDDELEFDLLTKKFDKEINILKKLRKKILNL